MRWVSAFLLCVLAGVCQLTFLQPEVTYCLDSGTLLATYQSAGRAIDLYTQKEPYSGRGLNQSSDVFAPQEEVILYAYVTYNDDPVANKIVHFDIHNPTGSFSRTAMTDTGGLANVSYRIPWPVDDAQTEVFGRWNVVASVEIAEETVADTLSFEVGWIIEIIKVETLDINNLPKTNFTKGEGMHFKLTVKNIALTEKIATFTVDVYDELGVSLGTAVLEDAKVSPGISNHFVEGFLIPTSAFVGVGVVYANAYNVFGEPYCPQVDATYWIVRLVVRDVAVINVVPSVTEVTKGHVVEITVVVRNEGDIAETFDISTYYDSVLIGTSPVVSLPSGSQETLVFGWGTSCVPTGVYTLSAVSSTVPGEIDIQDNTFVDGVVRVGVEYEPSIFWKLPAWIVWLFIMLVFLVAAGLIISVWLMFYVRKKKRNSTAKVSTPVIFERGKHKKCVECGREFLGVWAFCPHCFAYNG